MSQINVEIKNIAQIKRAFGAAPVKMGKELNDTIKRVIFIIQRLEFTEYHALGIRVITAGLYRSIEKGVWYGNLKGEVGPDAQGANGVFYSRFVHDGTRFMQGRPFLLNAVQSADKEVQDNFAKAVQNVLDDIAKDAG